MNNKERLAKCDSIMRRQNSGQITKEQASLEFDELLMGEDPTRLIYYCDSTGLTAEWDKDVMLFPTPESTPENRTASNTGIYVRGPKRGWLITRPAGAKPNCHQGALKHFQQGSKGWDGWPVATI